MLPAPEGVRPTVEDHGEKDGTSAVPLIFDELGPYDTGYPEVPFAPILPVD